MRVVVQYADEARIHKIANLKTVRLNKGFLEMTDKNGIFRGSINPEKTVILRIESENERDGE